MASKGEKISPLQNITNKVLNEGTQKAFSETKPQAREDLFKTQQQNSDKIYYDNFVTQQLSPDYMRQIESPVLLVQNIPLELNDPKLVFELFSQIGSVSKVLLMTNQFKGFVEFSDLECS